MENKYKTGEMVYERIFPSKKLIISRYADRLYYCKPQENLKRKEMVYFERELMADIDLGNKAKHAPFSIGTFLHLRKSM